MAFLLRVYQVSVRGFSPVLYDAATPGQARAKAWLDYSEARGTSFGDFLKICTVRRVDPPAGFGEPVLVSGRPAYRCLPVGGHYVRFVRDGDDRVLYSHPADVQAVPA